MKYLNTFNNYFTGSHQIKLLLGTLILLVVSDGVISKFLVAERFGLEGNPFLQDLVGEEMFLVAKMMGVFLAALILWDIHKRHPKLSFTATLCFVISYTIIVFWNIFVFFITQV